ncbi:MAG TPA: hypothetical protein VKE70_04365, partial [Candidatus Solibacter sp.]|nr:hypothetical protein [Candidatus Solibacter sp.]
NALDWLVGSSEFVNKPVALFNASSRGVYAQASLTETLTVMTARVLAGATVELMGRRIGAEQIAADPEMSAALRGALEDFAANACPDAA